MIVGRFANDRLIDLSEGAARQLGIAAQGVAGVRVRRVNPPEQEKSVLRQGMTAAERIETPEPLLKVLRDKLAKQPRPSVAVARKPVPDTGTGKAARQHHTIADDVVSFVKAAMLQNATAPPPVTPTSSSIR